MGREEENKNKGENKNILDKGIDFIFSNDVRKYLLLILILGAILRFIVARNISALGDEMVHGPHAIGFLHSGLISTILHSPLWFYLTDIAFYIFGVTMFSSRFLSFFFGSLSILVVYLIASKIFDKKIALISSFLLSVSYFTIRYTLMEMDISALFFIILAAYFFIDSLENKKFPYLAAVSLGLAALIKTLSLFFVPAFLVGFFLFNKGKSEAKNNFKKLFIFGLIILLFFSPILIHNYLWYKDKGMVDTYFAQYFNIGNARQAYGGQSGYASGILFSRFFEGLFGIFKYLISLNGDPIIVILGILGIFSSFLLKDKRKYIIFFIVFELSGLFLLILSNWLPTHYTTMIPVLCIFGGFFIKELSKKFKEQNQKILVAILIIILIFQLYLLLPHLTSTSALSKTRDYAIEKMDKNSIVVADARIYRGRIAWLFNDFHYLESSFLSQILEINKNISGQDIQVKLYFVECVPDDCGWGTIRDQPEFNQSMENIVNLFSSVPIEKVISGGGGYGEQTGEPYFKIYQTAINIKPQIIQMIDSTHDWFYYPLNYKPKEKIFDRYEVKGVLDSLIYKFAWLVIIASIPLSIISPIILIKYLFIKNEQTKTVSNSAGV